MSVFVELGIILLLICANGILAMAEISIVASKKNRLKKQADEGSKKAKVALALANEPNNFLATVQVGITLIGILAGAFAGANITDRLAAQFLHIPVIAPYSRVAAMALVVSAITFLSLIIGELVPKRVGLNSPERFASMLAIPMQWLSKITSPLVYLLSASTDAMLKLFGVRASQEQAVSEDDVRTMIEQGLHAGIFHKVEHQVVQGVFELDRLSVSDLMSNRSRIVWLNVADPDEVNWRKIVASGHTYYPVYEGNRDNIMGMVSVKALWANKALTDKVELKNLVTPPLFVPLNMPAHKLLEIFKQSGRHIALVPDEFGVIQGLVSLTDILEALVGDITSKEKPKKAFVTKREDGSWLCEALVEFEELRKSVSIPILAGEEEGEFSTLAGFILHHIGRIPEEGEHFDHVGFRFEIMDMDRQRIDKILISRLASKG